ncbi:hypothetical protein [Bradyrhizobium valentinum]|uniref:Uncharacterized protein n=1 Tax=Bradyrhizobium valentinum TaxID=1518501 RepID=A0A0R3LPS2_9BRAD|nr:hypothetical protein [Bradyrhizobium valentinum]KRR07685.1 hypothetical protein CP49_40095 [Bradyrhizobium valentinum]KRR09139.1 hypothetical protein CQ10_41330 [Bradyrhizobium valentinum]
MSRYHSDKTGFPMLTGQAPSLPLDAIRRPRDTPIWKLEASLKCRSCRKGRSAPPVRMDQAGEGAGDLVFSIAAR